MLTRRHFLNRTALVSFSPLVPAFLSKAALAAESSTDDRMLVVIQLSGGNDGLNTVIPFADELYSKYRRELRIDVKDMIRLNDSLGLHPAMKAAGELFDDGRLAIVPGVGYPNPDRSHFRSMAIWHSARLDSADHTGQGWLGRAADLTRSANSTSPDAVFVGDGTLPAAVIGRRARALSLNNEKELHLAAGLSGSLTSSISSPSDDLSAFVQRTLDASFDAARRFAESSPSDTLASSAYPTSNLGQKLKLMSKIIRARGGTRIFYVEQDGYDTHSAQRFAHDRLLRDFSGSLKAFLDDMQCCGLADRVAVMVFSEFGRRVEENVSAGTDHGTSGPVFIAGASVKPGLHGEYPSLSNLVDGDLGVTTDFRSIYATFLTEWLGFESHETLAGRFDSIPLFG